ncbi:hypothetical protein ACLB6G_07875 [Zhengella sp. ZM62]|uniref:hypothetical protein n=1 Tax=Zhengella sedimenti TaxID=3390035 RepID=UPI003974ABA4
MAVLLSREMARRLIVLALLCAALAILPERGLLAGLMLAGAGLAVYVLMPRAPRPDNAFIYDRMPAVHGPDLVAYLLTGVFFALPFWARMGEEYLWADFGLLVHPSALLSWPLALISVSILWFSAHYAAFWLVIEPDRLQINRLEGHRAIRFADIARVSPFRRGLPKWMRWITPALIAAGKFGPAGAILLARDTVGITLTLRDGSRISIASEAFESPMRRLIKALGKNGIPIMADNQDKGD